MRMIICRSGTRFHCRHFFGCAGAARPGRARVMQFGACAGCSGAAACVWTAATVLQAFRAHDI